MIHEQGAMMARASDAVAFASSEVMKQRPHRWAVDHGCSSGCVATSSWESWVYGVTKRDYVLLIPLPLVGRRTRQARL